jgi:hypothetical protein
LDRKKQSDEQPEDYAVTGINDYRQVKVLSEKEFYGFRDLRHKRVR